MALLPKPKSYEETVGLNLNRMQAQIAKDMDRIGQVQSLSSSFIKDYFEHIPTDQVLFCEFIEADASTNSILEFSSLTLSTKCLRSLTSTETIESTKKSCDLRFPAWCFSSSLPETSIVDLILCCCSSLKPRAQGEVMTDESVQTFIERFDLDCNGSFDEVIRAALARPSVSQRCCPSEIHMKCYISCIKGFIDACLWIRRRKCFLTSRSAPFPAYPLAIPNNLRLHRGPPDTLPSLRGVSG